MKGTFYRWLPFIIGIICATIIETTKIIVNNNQNEYIQQLEQSLLEQTQEKEVYMRMLEETND